MRVFLTGCKGQLGRSLMALLDGASTCGCDLPELDFTDAAAIRKAILDFAPSLVIHAGAMTNVDACETDPDAAYRSNALGTQNVALACLVAGAEMMYISTNEVFDGDKDAPYLEFDETNPIGAYGRSKLAGERFVQRLVARHYIVRTAWLYARGGNNFCSKIVQLADERGELRVVSDEFGSPTYAPDLAEAVLRLVATGHYGTYHLTNEGVTSRFEWAQEILRLSGRGQVPIRPIHAGDWVRPAKPPRYAPLRNFCAASLGIRLRPWQAALEAFFEAPQ
jgi:dTDP-4-dehydrorhamnose reductase